MLDIISSFKLYPPIRSSLFYEPIVIGVYNEITCQAGYHQSWLIAERYGSVTTTVIILSLL